MCPSMRIELSRFWIEVTLHGFVNVIITFEAGWAAIINVGLFCCAFSSSMKTLFSSGGICYFYLILPESEGQLGLVEKFVRVGWSILEVGFKIGCVKHY